MWTPRVGTNYSSSQAIHIGDSILVTWDEYIVHVLYVARSSTLSDNQALTHVVMCFKLFCLSSYLPIVSWGGDR